MCSSDLVLQQQIEDEFPGGWSAIDDPELVITSVGRITRQKMGLLLHLTEGKTVLEQLLQQLGSSGVMILLGSGDVSIEARLAELAQQHDNLVFLKGFKEALGTTMYRAGQLFLMPSLFEPCGISQMLAMQYGQPCLVHKTGGLADTVQHNVTGWTFEGAGEEEQAAALLETFSSVLKVIQSMPEQYEAIRRAAREQQFDWERSAQAYVEVYDS